MHISQSAELIGPPLPAHLEPNVIARFNDFHEAKRLQKSLRALDQDVEVRKRLQQTTLKTLTVGDFSNRELAEQNVAQLKKQGIKDAWAVRLASGRYGVHAGAMEDEIFFWSRYELLRRLGYKEIDTALTPHNTPYYVVLQHPPRVDPVAIREQQKLIPHGGEVIGRLISWRGNSNISSINQIHVAAFKRFNEFFTPGWTAAIGARLDTFQHTGDYTGQTTEYDYLPSYLAYEEQGHRLVAGTQYIGWSHGPWDALGDRLSVKDMRFYLLDKKTEQRRLATPALRWEYKQNDYIIDASFVPVLRPATLPSLGQVWHPLDQQQGLIRGLKTPNTLGAVVKESKIQSIAQTYGGFGFQARRKYEKLYQAFTLQYSRQSEPYFRLSDAVRQNIAAGQSVTTALTNANGFGLQAEHPASLVASIEEGSEDWQFEFAFVRDVPITDTNFKMYTTLGIEGQGRYRYRATGYRTVYFFGFYARQLGTEKAILDRRTILRARGEVEHISRSRHWRFHGLTSIGLDTAEAYALLRFEYIGNQLLDIGISAHLFTGVLTSEYGFHRRDSALSIDWQANF